jgi:WD40 repeat protein
LKCPACGQTIDAAESVAEPNASIEARPKADSSPAGHESASNRNQIAHGSHRPFSDRPATLPAQIARFVIQSRLGAGAFGTVFRAFDPHLEREVALKVPNPGVLDSPKRVARFLREAKSAANLRHPHIVPVFDAGRDAGQYFIATAFISGQPLSDRIKEHGNEFRQVATWARELAEALAYAHEQGIVHRDVKPANCMVDEDDHLHLMDFGLAYRQEEESRLTNDGTVLGTPAYMAPEQAAGRETGPAADQYSVGVILYELLTGHPPFAGPVPVVIHNQIHTEPDPPHRHRSDVSKDLETICLKAISKNADQRYADCQALADDLRRWLEGEPILARRVGPIERIMRLTKRNPLTAGLMAAVALVLVAGTVISSAFALEASRRAAAEAIALKQATEAAERAEAEAKRAKESEVVAITAETRATREAALATLDKGLVLCQRGDAQRGLLTLVKALELAEKAGDRLIDDACRLNLTAWSASMPKLVHCQPTPTRITSLAFHPDGMQFAYALSGGTVRLVSSSQVPQSATEFHHPHFVRSIAFDRPGEILITACDDGKIRRWDRKTRELIGDPLIHQVPPTSGVKESEVQSAVLRITTDDSGKTILSHRGSSLAIWKVGEDNSIVQKVLDLGSILRVVQLSKDSSVIWGAPTGGGLVCWDAQTQQRLHTHGTNGQVTCMAAVGPNGIIAADISRNVSVIAAPGAAVRTDSVSGEVLSITANTERNLYAFGTGAMNCHVHEISTGKPVAPPSRMLGSVNPIDLGCGQFLAAVPQRGGIHIWQLPSHEGQKVISAPDNRIGRRTHLAISEENLYRVDEGSESTLHALHLPSPSQFVRVLHPETQSIDGHAGVLPAPDGALLLLQKGNPAQKRLPIIVKWHPGSKSLAYSVELAPLVSISNAVLSGDGSRLAVVGTVDGNRPGFLVLETATGRPVRTIYEPRPFWWPRLSLSRNGDRVFAGFNDGQTIAVEIASGLVSGQEFNTVQVNAITSSRSGNSLVIGPHDGILRHLDPNTFQQISPTLPLDSPVSAVTVTDDDRQIIAGAQSGKVRIFRTDLGRQIGPDFELPHEPTEILNSGQLGTAVAAMRNGSVVRYSIPVPWTGSTSDVKCQIEFLAGGRLDEADGLVTLTSDEIAERGQRLQRQAVPSVDSTSHVPTGAIPGQPFEDQFSDPARHFARGVIDGNGAVSVAIPGDTREIWCNFTGRLPREDFEVKRLMLPRESSSSFVENIAKHIRQHPLREVRLFLNAGQLETLVSAIAEISTLERIELSSNGSRLPNLSRVKQVSSLDLMGSAIDLSAGEALSKLPKLTTLRARHATLTNEGLAAILCSKSLHTLDIANSQILALPSPESSPGITHLDISGTAIGDESIPAIIQMRELIVLDVRSTHVTFEGVESVRRNLPACVVRAHSRSLLAPELRTALVDARGSVPISNKVDVPTIPRSLKASLVYVDTNGRLVAATVDQDRQPVKKVADKSLSGVRSLAVKQPNRILVAMSDGRVLSTPASLNEDFEEFLPPSGTLWDWAAHPIRNLATWCRQARNQGPLLSLEDRDEKSFYELGFGYDPIWSDDGESLWYTSSDQFGWCIMCRRKDVLTKVRIPMHPAGNLYPAPNRDGTLVAFAMKAADGTMQLGLLELESRKLSQLTASADGNSHASFSPDGRHIAFTRSLRAPASVVIVDIRTGAESVIATDALPIRPAWLPIPARDAAAQPAPAVQTEVDSNSERVKMAS